MPQTASFTLLVLLSATSSLAAELRFDPPLLKLGEVRGGPDLPCQAVLINRGATPLEIVDIERGCSCLKAQLEKRTLGPGETAILKLHLRTLGHKDGPYVWTLKVRYRNGGPIQEAALRLEARVRNEVTLEPAELILFVTGSLTQEMVLTDRRPRPLTLNRLDTNLPGVVLEQEEVRPGTYRVRLRVRGEAVPVGRHDGHVSLYTGDLEYPHLQLPVRITRSASRAIQAIPDRIRLSPTEGLRTTLIRLRSAEGGPLNITRAECPGLKCTWAANPGGGAVLRVTLDGTPARGAELRVIVEGIEGEIRVPVEWE